MEWTPEGRLGLHSGAIGPAWLTLVGVMSTRTALKYVIGAIVAIVAWQFLIKTVLRNICVRFNGVFLVALAVITCPMAAHAQWGISYNEHDWRITVGGKSYGLVQEFCSFTSITNGFRQTTIYFGPYTTATRFRAPWVTVVLLLPLGGAGLLLLTRFLPENRGS